MTFPSDQPMLYRFLGTERTYGPRTLDWVVRTYGAREDASAAPEQTVSDPSAWRSVEEWAAVLPSMSASAEQLARLEKLGVAIVPNLTFAEADRAIDAAEDHARASRGQRKPTALKLKKLSELGLSAPDNATRADVDKLLRAHELRQLGERLSARGLRLPADGITEDNRYECEDAVESLDFGLKQAAERGFKYQPAFPLGAKEMNALAEALEEFWSAAGDLDWEWANLVDEGTIALKPTPLQLAAVLPVLFDLIRSSRWSSDSSAFAHLAEIATSQRSIKGAS